MEGEGATRFVCFHPTTTTLFRFPLCQPTSKPSTFIFPSTPTDHQITSRRSSRRRASLSSRTPRPTQVRDNLVFVGFASLSLFSTAERNETKQNKNQSIGSSRLRSSLRTPPLFLFLSMSGGCTVQAIGFNDNYAKFADKGYAVFGISADSPTTQVSFLFVVVVVLLLCSSLLSLPPPLSRGASLFVFRPLPSFPVKPFSLLLSPFSLRLPLPIVFTRPTGARSTRSSTTSSVTAPSPPSRSWDGPRPAAASSGRTL